MYGQGANSVSIVGRLSTLWSVHYQRFHCISLWLYRYKGVVERKWFQHFHALLVSTFQLMGCILYLGCEWHSGFSHLPSPVSSAH